MSSHVCGFCARHDHGYDGQFPYGGHRSQDIFHRDENKCLPLDPGTLHPNGKCSGKMPGVVTGWYGGGSCEQWAPRDQ